VGERFKFLRRFLCLSSSFDDPKGSLSVWKGDGFFSLLFPLISKKKWVMKLEIKGLLVSLTSLLKIADVSLNSLE